MSMSCEPEEGAKVTPFPGRSGESVAAAQRTVGGQMGAFARTGICSQCGRVVPVEEEPPFAALSSPDAQKWHRVCDCKGLGMIAGR